MTIVLDVMIHHQPLNQFITRLECSLGALRLETFCDRNCRVGRGDFNAVKIMEKDAGLTAQMRSGILTGLATRSPSCHHLPPARMNSCALTTSHTLGGIILALIQVSLNLQK